MRAVAALLFTVLGGVGCASSRPPGRTQDDLQAKNLASFDLVWTTVRDRHWDPTLGGVDWEAVRVELRPAVARARTVLETRKVLSAALARLGQSHFAIVPAEAYGDLAGPERGEGGSAGLTARIVEGRPTVVGVLPGGAADRAGVRPGWIVRRVRGEDVSRSLSGLTGAVPGRTLQALALQAILAGAVGDSVEMVFEDGGGSRARRRLVLARQDGTPAKIGWLPTQVLRVEARQLEGGAAYVHFNLFLDPPTLMPVLESAIARARDGSGLVLDLRGNTGGIGLLAAGIGGWLVSERDRELGSMTLREGKLRFVIHPRAEVFTGPLAVLVDEVSVSTAEILAGGLQDLGRARIFGTRSAGAALPSAIERLPNGDGFQYALASYVRASGAPLEGRGVTPDVETPLTRAALLAGHDPALEAAEDWIRSQTAP